MKLHRVVMATDANPEYYQFWPTVAKRWASWGITPTLVVVSEAKLDIDESLGEVIYHTPTDDIPTAQQAQVIRLFAAASHTGVSLISDIDMLPLKKEYYMDLVDSVDENSMVIFSSDAYLPEDPAFPAYPMCYLAARGDNFKETIGGDIQDFNHLIKDWMAFGHGWHTDEKVFYHKLKMWSRQERIVKLKRGFNVSSDPIMIARIDRASNSQYEDGLINNNYYIDYHMPRPYEQYASVIDEIYTKTCRG